MLHSTKPEMGISEYDSVKGLSLSTEPFPQAARPVRKLIMLLQRSRRRDFDTGRISHGQTCDHASCGEADSLDSPIPE